MKNILLLLLITISSIVSAQEFPLLKGAYFGQNPPGMTPEIFAPGIISGKGRLHTSPAFTNDNKEVYWMVLPPQIMTMNESSQGWTNPAKAAFSVGPNNQAPFVAYDGKIYFASLRANGNGSLDIWYVNKSDTGYSLPINIGKKVNSSKSESMPSVSNKNTLFFSGNFDGKLYNRGIYYSKFVNGEYQNPVALPEQININNKNNLDYTPFIASDESYLLFSSNRQNPEKELCHIYISYKDENGDWGKPVDLSLKMNFNESSKFPFVSVDQKYLFFSSGENIYWVSADIIKEDDTQNAANLKFTNLKGDYLGQTPPGDLPLVFAKGYISVDSTIEHGSPTFSPDGNEVFWQSNYRQPGKDTQIYGMTMRRINGQWTKPEVSPYYSQMVFSLDGKRLHFIPSAETKMEGVHFAEKQTKGWGEPVKLDLIPRYPELKYAYSLSFTKDGTVYFFAHAEGLGTRNGFAIYRAKRIDGVYAKPELLPSSINMGENVLNWTPFIDPDESYLIFSSNREGQQDLYICFRKPDGSWTEPQNLGEPFNTKRGERFPTLSPDGKYLFFTRWLERGNEDAMWVSTDFIHKLKEETFSEKK